jgi:hypothetical protein
MPFGSAVGFLQAVGFDFDRNPSDVELARYDKETLHEALEALEDHIRSLGGQIDSGVKFDPYKSTISSTNFQNGKVPVANDTYDPTLVQQQIDRIKEEQMRTLKNAKVVDRDVKVFQIQQA